MLRPTRKGTYKVKSARGEHEAHWNGENWINPLNGLILAEAIFSHDESSHSSFDFSPSVDTSSSGGDSFSGGGSDSGFGGGGATGDW